MEAILLAAVLSLPVTPDCQQWLDRVDKESRAAARLVWSPQKERHIRRMNEAAEKVEASCYLDSDEGTQVAELEPVKSKGYSGAGF